MASSAGLKDILYASDISALSNLSIIRSLSTQPTCSCPPLTIASQFLAAVTPLAALRTIQDRTLTTGHASILDILVLCPSIHTQQAADLLPGGIEFPATAAMTTGYVFRTENQAMVSYMQRIGTVGALVTVRVVADKTGPQSLWAVLHHLRKWRRDNDFSAPYLAIPPLTVAAMWACVRLGDCYAVAALLLLVSARVANVLVLRRRVIPGWHGVAEPGVEGDLLVLLSQDRWVRLRGLVDDLKAVTSGSWLQKMTAVEEWVISAATVLVYLAGASAVCSSFLGSIVLVSLLMLSTGLLGLSNRRSEDMRMHGRVILVIGEPKLYKRRLDMAKELINEHNGRDDWAIGLGMIVPDHERVIKTTM
jgi:hypothetical protein